MKPKNPIESFRFAIDGIVLSFRSQRHLRVHFVLAVLALLAGFVWGLSRLELLILVGAISLVILTELLNTAVETVVDLVTKDFHPLAKTAKDIAAGAVLVAAVNAALVGAVLFLDVRQVPSMFARPPARVGAVETVTIGFLLVLLLLVIWKVKGGKGSFLHGGVVSGHSAIAFFLCTIILLIAGNPIVALMGILLAALVSQSRVEAGVHSVRREVLYGALLGILVPTILYRVIPFLIQSVGRSLGMGS